jgi:hypothetical protein
MSDQFTPTPVKGLKSHNATAPTNDNVAALVGVASNSAPSYVEGNEVKHSLTLLGSLRVTDANETEREVDIRSIAGAPITVGEGNVTANTPRIAIADDNVVRVSKNNTNNAVDNTIAIQESNGTGFADFGAGATTATTKRVVIANDQSAIRVSKNNNDNAVANTIWTTLSDGTNQVGTSANPLFVQSDFSAGTPKSSFGTATAVAAGAQSTIAGAAIAAGKTGQLAQVVVSASVRFKATVERFDGTNPVTVAVLFGDASSTATFKPVDNSLYTATGTGSKFQVTVKNLDNLFAADIYSTIEYYEV